MRQRWSELTFLHWPLDPDRVAPLLPPGTRPDVWDGSTWIGLIAFAMREVRVPGTPPLPWLSSFPETNVRAYAIDRAGRRSVVFLSLDITRLIPVLAARSAYRLPYIWSRMQIRRTPDEITYTARRRLGSAASRIRVRIGEPVTATPLDDFLTARWGLHSRWYGTDAYVPITHAPWPLRSAELVELDDDLVASAGLPRPQGPPRVLYSDGVDVALGAPQPLHRDGSRRTGLLLRRTRLGVDR